MRQTAPRVLLGLAAAAIMFAAADTYVVVLALPDMMTTVGLDLDQLQRAAPIVSGFLLGYVGVLPLIGRISDLRGRVPVLLGSLIVFAIGSVITAAAYDLPSIVTGRLIQGIGGGGLIPPTLALVADLWPPARRGLPLGIVGAVQELGSVVGPLYGAVVLSFGSWRDIFWLNCAVGLVLAAAMVRMRDVEEKTPDRPGRFDAVGLALGLLGLVGLSLVMLEPDVLTTGVTSGLAFLPVVGESRWLTPIALSTFGIAAVFIIRQATARRPLLAWRDWAHLGRETDLRGALMLTVGLGRSSSRSPRPSRRARRSRPAHPGSCRSQRSPSPGSGGASARPHGRWCRAAPSAHGRPGEHSWCRSSSVRASSPRSSTSRSSPA